MYKLLTFIFIASISACSALIPQKDIAVRKSQNDAREYRYLQLDNGLKVMLVSDPQADFSAASLDVYTGSGSDPEQRQGLAHFLEHMLFLGTEKYPDADDYLRFLKDNGGNHNAYTSFEHTNYFFDIRPDVLEPTLDRFAQFFIAPLLTEKYVEREKHAVDSEYKAGIKDESRRQIDALRQLINDEHPFDKFSVGNLDTLSSAKTPIKDDLQAFYRKHYVAGNMALAVLGREPLDRLEAMVREKFAAVPKGQVPDRKIDVPILGKDALGKVLYIKPEKNLRELTLLFPLPDQTPYYRSKPLDVVAHVLGHEGRGSLLSYLKAQDWVESLSSSQAFSYNGGTLFMINVELTELGLGQQDAIVQSIFQAINRLRQEGVPPHVFDEIARVSQLEFDFKEKEKPMGYVLGIANDLHYYNPAEVLTAERLVDEYDANLTHRVLEKLVPENMLMVIVTERFEPDAKTGFYQVPYAVKDMPASLMQSLAAGAVNDQILLPEKNDLLPDELALAGHDGQERPRLLQEKPGVQLWHKPVQQFRVPKATSYFSFSKEAVRASVQASVLLDLYIALLNDDFNEWVYPAHMAGLSLQLYGQVRGVTLKIDGFSDKQDELLVQALDHIRQAGFDDAQFARIKAMLLRDWENAEKQPPYQKLMTAWNETLQKPSWGRAEKMAALQVLQKTDVEQFAVGFWRDMDILALVNGNIREEQAKSMLARVEGFVSGVRQIKPDITVAKLDEKINVQQVVASEHPDSAYLLYWQAPAIDVATQARFMLLASALESGFFNELRTEQQLGYVVFAGYAPLMSVPGMVFVVQSPSAKVEGIHAAVMAFLQDSSAGMQLMPAEYLQQLQQSLVQELLQQPLSLVQESDSYWYDLSMGYRDFDRKQQLADAIRMITPADWQQFIQALYAQADARMMLFSTHVDKAVGEFVLRQKGERLDKSVYRFGRE